MKKIEMVGFDKSYEWRAQSEQSRDISLSSMKIGSTGTPGCLRQLIPGTFNLYMDKNLLHSWD
jgi:hypothetical protein